MSLQVDFDESRDVFSSLNVAAQPVIESATRLSIDFFRKRDHSHKMNFTLLMVVLGMAGHRAKLVPFQIPARPANTQVSLLPPPCDEFTTSEPFLRATRVSPPGITKFLCRKEYKGANRRGVPRNAHPPGSARVTVRASVEQCKLRGLAFTFFREFSALILCGMWGQPSIPYPPDSFAALMTSWSRLFQHIIQIVRLGANICRNIWQYDFFAKIIFHDSGHVCVHHLVIGHNRRPVRWPAQHFPADRLPLIRGLPASNQRESIAGSRKVIVNAPINDIHALKAFRRAQCKHNRRPQPDPALQRVSIPICWARNECSK